MPGSGAILCEAPLARGLVCGLEYLHDGPCLPILRAYVATFPDSPSDLEYLLGLDGRGAWRVCDPETATP